MSTVSAEVMYEQLRFMLDSGHDLSDYFIDECDSFGGEAIILPKEDENE